MRLNNTVKRIGVHVPIGFATPFIGELHWVYAVIYSFGFWGYETIQEYNFKGNSHYDVAGFIIGLATGVIIKLITGLSILGAWQWAQLTIQ